MSRNELPQPLREAREIKLKALRYRGMIEHVAKKLSVHPAHVLRVFTGERKSPRVEAALAWEIERINRQFQDSEAA